MTRLLARWLLVAINFYSAASYGETLLKQQNQSHRQGSQTQCQHPLKTVSSLYQLDSLKASLSNSSLAGKTIRHIKVYRLDVFDETNPKENHLLFRLLNDVHIRTRESVILNQLLFKAAEPFNIKLAQESERLLRSRDYLVDALIIPETICPDDIDLAVITRDSWSLEIDAGFSEEGNQTQTSLGIRSTNLLGTGDHAMVSYKTSPERDKVLYQYASPHFLGSRYRTGFYYSDNSDGSEKRFSLSHPFYALHTPFSYGLSADEIQFVQNLKQQNNTVLEFDKTESRYNLFAGYSPLSKQQQKDDVTHRITAGFRREQDQVSPIDTQSTTAALPLTSDKTRQYPWLSYSFTENDYAKFRNINQLHKTEDLNLGQRFYTKWGLNDEIIVFKLRYSDTLYNTQKNKHLSAYTLGIKGIYLTDEHEHENSTAYASFTYHYLVSERQRWYTHWRIDQGFGLTADKSLSFTDSYILRGYPSGYQFGDKRFIGSVEHRIFYDYHLFNLFRIGQVAFIDVGRAWGKTPASQPNAPTNQAIYDVGFGLRFSSTKARVKNVVHADIAFPLNDRETVDRYQLTIKTQQRF